MPKRTSKRPDKGLDVVQNAKRVMDEAVSRSTTDLEISVSRSTISFVMAQMGRKGGQIGGKRRMDTMTPEQRTANAKLAAKARWADKKKESK